MLSFQTFFDGSSDSVGSYALAFYSAYFAFMGINLGVNIVEEIEEPLTKNVVMSVTISHLAVTVVYLLANMAYVIVLTPEEILASDAVAMTFGDKVLPVLFWLMPFFVACSTFGSLSNGLMSFSRLN